MLNSYDGDRGDIEPGRAAVRHVSVHLPMILYWDAQEARLCQLSLPRDWS